MILYLVYFLVGLGILLLICVFIGKCKTKQEIEYEEKLKKSLDDEFIIDPETGIKLTLEEAETGIWKTKNTEHRSRLEIEKLAFEEDKQVEKVLNYYRKKDDFQRIEFDETEIHILKSTKMLGKYDNWNYSNCFKFNNGFVFLPAPEIYGTTYYQDDYCESHIMYWLKMSNIDGHYYLKEKEKIGKVISKIIKSDDNNIEIVIFKESLKNTKILEIARKIENLNNIDIEIYNENLFIKSNKLVSLEDTKRIENIIKTFANTLYIL